MSDSVYLRHAFNIVLQAVVTLCGNEMQQITWISILDCVQQGLSMGEWADERGFVACKGFAQLFGENFDSVVPYVRRLWAGLPE